MHLRRTLALAASTLVLATVTTSCGFDYATDRVDTPAVGVNNRDKTVDVLGAMIVAGQADAGTFVALLSNNSDEAEISFESLTGGPEGEVGSAEFAPIEIPREGAVQLLDEAEPIGVEGTFEAGDFVPVTLGFSNGEQVTLEIPVVLACDEFEGLDTASAASGGSVESDEAYSCEAAEAPAEGH